MKSVAKRRCARGQNCYHVRKLHLSQPVVLRGSHEGSICDKCKEADRREPAKPVPREERRKHSYQVLETRTGSEIEDLKRELVGQLSCGWPFRGFVACTRVPIRRRNSFSANGDV